MNEKEKVYSNYKRFYYEVGLNYEEENIIYSNLRGKLRKEFILNIMADWQGCMLDLGCNTGVYLREFKGGRAVGVDISFPVLKRANEFRFSAGHKLLITGDAERLKFLRSEVFDFILCSEVIEHLHEPDKALEECFRALKKGGIILITAPYYSKNRPDWISLGILKKYTSGGVKGDTYFHTAYKPEELALMLEKAGFSVQDSGTLEKEIKYVGKIPAAVKITMDAVNNYFFKSMPFLQFNEKIFQLLLNFIFSIFKYTHLRGICNKLVKAGVRSYIIGKK